ncbi:MAG: hypothetical protein CL512_04905 [Actinobacteria bacterium]|nr:hypothetical protein [Actinomycetota bacterium]
MKMRKMKKKDFDQLEAKFYATVRPPVHKPLREVFGGWVVGLKNARLKVELLAKGHTMYGERSRMVGGTLDIALRVLKRASFVPPTDLIDKVVACPALNRVAYLLKSGLQVVDSLDGSLAVHIMRDPLLAENLVQGFITVRSAKRDIDYLARVLHNEGYEEKVMAHLG